jgi:hypothetical protein
MRITNNSYGQARQQCVIPRKLKRSGNILVLIAIFLPVLCGLAALIFDGGLLMRQHRDMQHASDAAATAAAFDLRLGHGRTYAADTAKSMVLEANNEPTASVNVSIPPTTGPFAGKSNFVEVNTQMNFTSKFSRIADKLSTRSTSVRSVAGLDDVTTGAAIVVLDQDPDTTSIPGSQEVLNQVPSNYVTNSAVQGLDINQQLSSLGLGILLNGIQSRLTASLDQLAQSAIDTALTNVGSEVEIPALPTVLAGMETEGLGQLRVDGAILVNTKWGGVDENGGQVGDGTLPYGMSCTPLLSLTQVRARDIRVSGGVDLPSNYQSFEVGQQNPLRANRLPVPDPFEGMPTPSTSSDGANVSSQVHNPADAVIVSIGPASTVPALSNAVLNDVLGPLNTTLQAVVKPVIAPVVTSLLEALTEPPQLKPGVYNSITVVSLGDVTFQPGVYIVRGTNPQTKLSLSIIGGSLQAKGVLFYITDSANFDAATGTPDLNDDSSESPGNPLLSSTPSALIAPLLLGSHISGLNDPGSPFNGMLVYQRRLDRRPILVAATKLVGGGDISGTIYSKWGHVAFLGGSGSYDLRICCGTLRVLTAFTTTLAPTNLLPAAQDVLLVE